MTHGPPQAYRPTLLDLIRRPGAQRVPRVVQVASPAAGADWTARVPGGVVWQLLAVHALLTTSAVVATRVPRLSFTDGNIEFLLLPPGTSVAASGIPTFGWVPGFGTNLQLGNANVAPLASGAFPLVGGWTVGSSTFAIDVSDQWSSITLYVVESRPALNADLAGTSLPSLEII